VKSVTNASVCPSGEMATFVDSGDSVVPFGGRTEKRERVAFGDDTSRDEKIHVAALLPAIATTMIAVCQARL